MCSQSAFSSAEHAVPLDRMIPARRRLLFSPLPLGRGNTCKMSATVCQLQRQPYSTRHTHTVRGKQEYSPASWRCETHWSSIQPPAGHRGGTAVKTSVYCRGGATRVSMAAPQRGLAGGKVVGVFRGVNLKELFERGFKSWFKLFLFSGKFYSRHFRIFSRNLM